MHKIVVVVTVQFVMDLQHIKRIAIEKLVKNIESARKSGLTGKNLEIDTTVAAKMLSFKGAVFEVEFRQYAWVKENLGILPKQLFPVGNIMGMVSREQTGAMMIEVSERRRQERRQEDA